MSEPGAVATGSSGPEVMKLKMRYQLLMALALVALAIIIIDFGATTTLAQCVMCRASLGNNSSFIRNFNIGVLVLLVPPVSIFCTIFIVAIRHRRSG
jgi:hypothetical protein